MFECACVCVRCPPSEGVIAGRQSGSSGGCSRKTALQQQIRASTNFPPIKTTPVYLHLNNTRPPSHPSALHHPPSLLPHACPSLLVSSSLSSLIPATHRRLPGNQQPASEPLEQPTNQDLGISLLQGVVGVGGGEGTVGLTEGEEVFLFSLQQCFI